MKQNIEIIDSKRNYSIYKKNELIQKGRYSLTLNQQKTLLFLISKITDGTAVDKTFQIDIAEYCKVAGINSSLDAYYHEVKADLKAIADASIWVAQPDGKETLLRWLDIVRIDEGNSTIQISFTKSIAPYLFFFTQNGNYTSYPLLYILPMCCKYSIRLYELLKSYSNQNKLIIDVEQLKLRIDAKDEKSADYERFVDFRRYVIDRAIDQINQYTDIKVEYKQIKEGKKTKALQFFITSKNWIQKSETKRNDRKNLQKPQKQEHHRTEKRNAIEAITDRIQALDTITDIIYSKQLSEQELKKIQDIITLINQDYDNIKEMVDKIKTQNESKQEQQNHVEPTDPGQGGN